MPQLIEYLDKIARKKQRDVLSLSFIDSSMELAEILEMDFDAYKPFLEVTAWLDANEIQWQPCCLQNSMVIQGRIYIDVPFDEADPVYKKLAGYLENPDGSMKIQSVAFQYMPLTHAMEYACQDEPGYWEKYWADDFNPREENLS
jgi:hypothetical protein